MSILRIAKRYSRALIDMAIDEKSLEKVHNDILFIDKVLEDERELRLILKNPIVKYDKKKNILKSIFEGKVENITVSFLELICNKNRTKFLQEILKEFIIEYREYMGIQSASIVTAVKLPADLKDQVIDIVKSISGKKTVDLKEEVNEDIIGGFILKVGDKQINDSVSGRLRDIRSLLVDSRFEQKT